MCFDVCCGGRELRSGETPPVTAVYSREKGEGREVAKERERERERGEGEAREMKVGG